MGFAWLVYTWFVKAGIWSQEPGTALRRRTPLDNAALDARGKRDYERATTFLKRGLPVAGFVMVVGVVVAVG